jgi:hypothetical protein
MLGTVKFLSAGSMGPEGRAGVFRRFLLRKHSFQNGFEDVGHAGEA